VRIATQLRHFKLAEREKKRKKTNLLVELRKFPSGCFVALFPALRLPPVYHAELKRQTYGTWRRAAPLGIVSECKQLRVDSERPYYACPSSFPFTHLRAGGTGEAWEKGENKTK
jgi:hypothetical protein